MARVLVMSFSDLGRDPRVDRQVRFLRDDHEVVTAGFGPSSQADLEFRPIDVEIESFATSMRRRALALPGVAMRRYERMHWTMPIHAATRRALDGVKPDVVLVNDVQGMPAAFEAANGAPVILDSHEHAPTEYAERRSWRFLGGPYADWLLRSYAPQLAVMMTVSQGIADAYAAQYGVQVDVLTNAPFRYDLEPSPVGQPLRLIHHGIGAPRRQQELLIEAVRPLAGTVTLDLMLAAGLPEYIDGLARLAEPLEHVRVIPPVPYGEMIPAINAYDVGVHLIPPGPIHDYYALPNKVFEFIQARVALAVSPSPDMRRVVDEHGLGVVAAAPTPQALREVLGQLDADSVAAFKQASHRAADILCAENNRERLLAMVQEALAGRRAAIASSTSSAKRAATTG